MPSFFKIIFLWGLLSSSYINQVFALESAPVDTGKVVASLVSTHDSVAPGDTISIALRTVLDPHWHTYWRNPGDSGEAVQIEWQLPSSITSLGDIYWPLPETIATGPIINYGFEGAPLFPQDFKISKTVQTGDKLTIDADVYYLVCKDVCIPEQGKLSLSLPVGPSVRDNRWSPVINIAKDDTPQKGNITAAVSQISETLSLTFTDIDETADISNAYFFPYKQGLVAHSEPQIVEVGELDNGKQGLRLTTIPDYLWEETSPPSLEGVLRFEHDGTPTGQYVNAILGEAVKTGLPAVLAPGAANGIKSASTVKRALGNVTIFSAIIGAFLGGIILNLMPCVFPVISIKALSIARSAHEDRRHIRREAWIYAAGVMVTFLALTVLLLSLKAAGSEIGWGFQLQSPKVVALLAVLLFAIGLNLLGVFEFGTALQNTGTELTQKSGGPGAFFTGALAVIVATPCTSPFMAGAIGFALAQPAIVTLTVFMFLGIGFALPFLLIAYVPAILSRLPKPGPWMIRFKEILAFPMLAAAIWLVWVLSLQSGADGVLAVLSAMLLLALAIWLFKRHGAIAKALASLALIATLILPLSLKPPQVQAVAVQGPQIWSSENVETLRAQGQAVFVDFTAAWCVTCKVNEKLVLDRPEAKALFQKTNTAVLIADWTNKNDIIARELAKYGRSGVPLYLLFPPQKTGEAAFQNSVNAVILPQVLTQSVLEDAINDIYAQ